MTAPVSHLQRSATLRRLAFGLALAVLGACVGCGGGQRSGADGAAGLRVVREQHLSPRLEQWTLRTPALRGDTRVCVLLPAGYDRHPRRRYPVLYLLHGRSGDYRDWTRHGAAAAITARSPLIVVMPDGGRMGSYTDWYRAGKPVPPEWETYHIQQLIPWVDRRFRTTGGRRGRAIAGLSMGGFGALSYAGRHPGLFTAVASFSGALEVGSAAAWGARADNAARWRAHLPIDLAPELRSLALVELRTGNGTPGPLDHPGLRPHCEACRLERLLHSMNVRLHYRLHRLGIRHVWEDYGPGTHSWPYWRRDLRETLPDLLKALAPPRG
jgi:diacylglycerol O-acyltransferase / trehalose O-mycolyltransferase